MKKISARVLSIVLIGILFILAGIGHFVFPKTYLRIMPPQLSYPLELVYLSGIFEILGGVGILFPALRRWAGYGLIVLLILVFPANIYMASSDEVVPEVPNWLAVARLPLQFLLIAWVYWAISADDAEG